MNDRSITSSTDRTVSAVNVNTIANSGHLVSLVSDSNTLKDLAVEIKASLDSSSTTTSSIEQNLSTLVSTADRGLSDIDSKVTTVTSSLSSMRITTEQSLHIVQQQQATIQCLPSIEQHTASILDLETVQAEKVELVQNTVERSTDLVRTDISNVNDNVLQLLRFFMEDQREREAGSRLVCTKYHELFSLALIHAHRILTSAPFGDLCRLPAT